MSKTTVSTIEQTLETTFAKAPSMPDDLKKLIVKYIPILSILGAVFSLLSSGVLGLATTMPYGGLAFYGFAGVNFYLNIILSIVIAIILFRAYGPLKEKKMGGWRSLLYLSLIVGVFNVVLVNVGGIIGAIISLYILFSIKPLYK